MSIGPNTTTVWNIPLVPGSTLEITLAQFWSSLGSSTLDSIFISFHGLVVEGLNPSGSEAGSSITLDPSLGPRRILVRAPLRDEKVKPELKLDAVSWTLRPEPSNHKPQPLSTLRDTLWDSRVIYSLYLTYKLTSVEGGKYEFTHAFNTHVYDGEFEGQMLMIHEADGKKLVGCSDIYPKSINLKKGVEYSLRLMLRHDKRDLLASMSGLPLNVKRKLDSPLSLSLYPKKNLAITSTQAVSEAINVKSGGTGISLFIAPLADDKTLPKDATVGRTLIGKLSLGQALSGSCPEKTAVAVSYLLPPPKPAAPPSPDDPPATGAEAKDDADTAFNEAVRDAKIKHMKDLKISAPFYASPDSEAEVNPIDRIYRSILEELLASHPNHLPLLTEHMKKIDSLDKEVQRSTVRGLESIVAAADLVINAVDPVAIQVQLGIKCPAETAESKKAKKEAEDGKTALIDAWTIKSRALLDMEELLNQREDSKAAVESFSELRKWVDTGAEPAHALLHARFEAREMRLASALQVLDKALAAEDAVKSGADDMRAFKLRLTKDLGWKHLVADEEASIAARACSIYNFSSPL